MNFKNPVPLETLKELSITGFKIGDKYESITFCTESGNDYVLAYDCAEYETVTVSAIYGKLEWTVEGVNRVHESFPALGYPDICMQLIDTNIGFIVIIWGGDDGEDEPNIFSTCSPRLYKQLSEDDIIKDILKVNDNDKPDMIYTLEYDLTDDRLFKLIEGAYQCAFTHIIIRKLIEFRKEERA